jgi:hypothetical protein
MQSRTIRPDTLGVVAAVSAAFAGTLGTFLLARPSRVSGWALLALAVVAASAAWYLHQQGSVHAPDTATDSVDISDWGIRHFRNDLEQSSVSWTDLEEVLGVTVGEGEVDETLYLVLNGTSGASISLPHAAAVESGLLDELERHFATCDTTTFYDAAIQHGPQVFILWRAERAAVHTPVSHDWQVRPRDDRAS